MKIIFQESIFTFAQGRCGFTEMIQSLCKLNVISHHSLQVWRLYYYYYHHHHYYSSRLQSLHSVRQVICYFEYIIIRYRLYIKVCCEIYCEVNCATQKLMHSGDLQLLYIAIEIMNDIQWCISYHTIIKEMLYAKLSCPVFSTNSYITGINQVKTFRQALSKSSQHFCSNKGRSVLIACLHLSLNWNVCPSLNTFSKSERVDWSAKKR